MRALLKKVHRTLTPQPRSENYIASILSFAGLGFMVWGLGLRVWGLGFWVWGLGFWIWGLGLWA